MEQTYLPGDARERIIDLMKEKSMTQQELAARTGMTVGTLSRFLCGKIDKLSADNVISIARIFQVSTDFLLGESNDRGRINYDIGELGLSVQAARNLYTGRVDSRVVNLLLENPRFGLVTELAAEYFSGAIAAGYAARNQVLSSAVKEMAKVQKWSKQRKAAAYQAARRAEILKIPVSQPNLNALQEQFLLSIKEIKRNMVAETASLKIDRAALLTKQTAEELYAKLRKGQDSLQTPLQPEEMADALVDVLKDLPLKDRAVLEQLRAAFTALFENLAVDTTDAETTDHNE